MDVLDVPAELLEQFAAAGVNLRVMRMTQPAVPPLGERKIHVVRLGFDDLEFVVIAPYAEGYHLTYHHHCDNRRDEGPMIVSVGARQDRASVTLSTGISYEVRYRRDQLRPDLQQIMTEHAVAFDLHQFFPYY
jgi:hypothetical protein